MISMIRRYGRLQAKSALLSVAVMGCCMMPSLQAQGPYPTGCYTFPNYSQCHPTPRRILQPLSEQCHSRRVGFLLWLDDNDVLRHLYLDSPVLRGGM
jgi:hypothetical protein